jgi:peptidoglycan/LPS O-acetylase OafA/YrhL
MSAALGPLLAPPVPPAPAEPVASAPRRRLGGLDSLRGVAILMVIAFHVQLHFGVDTLLGRLAALGYNGVQLFFIVSGVTMCYMWSLRADEPRAGARFLVRRLCRIAPPFWFAAGFYLAWRHTGLAHLAPVDGDDVALTLMLLHGLSPHAINAVVPGGWSIAAEVGFYLLFPVLVARARSARQRSVLALAAYLACSLLAWTLRSRLGLPDEFLYYSLLTALPVFLAAMALYALRFDAGPHGWRAQAAIAAAWLALAVVGRHLGGPGRPGMWAEVLVMLAACAAVLGRRDWAPLAFLGRLSYSAYLFHFAVIDVLVRWLPFAPGDATFLAALVAALAGTIAVAWVSSRTLEAWSIEAGRRIVARMGAGLAAPAA